MLFYDAKVFWQKHCYLLTHFSDGERGVAEEEAPPSNLRNFYNYGAPCPPPALDGAGPYEAYPRDPCESTENFPPDAWRPHNDSQPALTCHLRDGCDIKGKRSCCRAYDISS